MGMKVITTLGQAWASVSAEVTRQPIVWVHLRTALTGAGVLMLMSERSRRKTLLTLATQAPRGIRLIQKRGLGGPAVFVQVGFGMTACKTLPEQE